MDKGNTLFLHSTVEDMCPNNVFGQTFSDSDRDVQDKRVAQLLVLLQQLTNPREDWEHCRNRNSVKLSPAWSDCVAL